MDSAIQRLNKQGLDRNHENFAKIHTTRRWRTKSNFIRWQQRGFRNLVDVIKRRLRQIRASQRAGLSQNMLLYNITVEENIQFRAKVKHVKST